MGPVFKKIEKETPGGSVKHLSAKIIKDILIPILSLSEQQWIVEQLDTFTSSIENLKQQIVLGSQQYTLPDGRGRAEVFANAIKHDYKSPNPTTRWKDVIKLK